mgnify:FL=1|jgi:hypothetical protein
MRFHANRSRVSSAGTRVALSAATGAPDANSRVLWIKVSARTGNGSVVYFGDSAVASTLGYELSANDSLEIDLKDKGGSVLLSTFYADAGGSNQDLDWVVILDG